MRAALVVPEVTANAQVNVARAIEAIAAASKEGAEIVVFPEAALTGLVNNGDPVHDLPLGAEVPGSHVLAIGAAARTHSVHVAYGLLEREGDRLFSSAVLHDDQGDVVMHYRRVHPGWRTKGCDEDVYGVGDVLPAVETALGRVAFMLCGDIFDDRIAAAVRDNRPEWLLALLWRALPDGSVDMRVWERSEEPAYAERVAVVGSTTLMVNALADEEVGGGACGGGWLRRANGDALAMLPLGRPGMLVVDAVI